MLQAGDSRVYIMRPANGLQQFSRDELVGNPDALNNLYATAPLANVINIDTDFTLTRQSMDVLGPFAVMCATDGFFGYSKTPMHLERDFLNCLNTASSFEDFEKKCDDVIGGAAGDDATAVMAFYGWRSLANIQADFAKRIRFINGMCGSLDSNWKDELIESAWAQYKPTYYI